MTFPCPVFSPKASAAPPASAITYIGKFVGSQSGGTITIPSVPIATGASDVVVVGFVREAAFSTTISGLAVGSTGGTLWGPGDVVLGFITGGWLEYFFCQPGALSTANIVATVASGTVSTGYFFVWVLTGTTATPLDAVSSAQATSTTVALNDIETKVGGAVMAIGICEPTITGWTETWSGSETVVEDDDLTSNTGNHRIVACHFATTAASTTQDLTLTLAASQAHIGGAISFGP
ncbi:hypothetical protein C1D09_003870 [Mesorhizobium intechi]|uniref:Uncharacterized protein n=1 Tax=Mesorhizobium intechi TaxID=537601 RepID=A0A8T9AXB8_9HYPH|nr:hypothetical protein [Mesorhizobium intechi]TSE13460.1 hypothetical protein C1D09_003870 [Mesorhizobium intechi]